MTNKPFSTRLISLLVVVLIGFLIRLYFTRFGNFGDIVVFAEWGRRFWDLDLKEFYFDKNWYYSFPTYPPASILLYAGLYWLYDKRFVLAEIHNAVKIIPASFIIYFSEPVPKDPFLYGFGYFLLLKLPSILADLGIGLLIYKIVFDITKSINRAFLGLISFIFNPITIFISSVWGQNDSLVSFFGLFAFILLIYKKVWLSIPLLFISLYLKPNWIIFIPVYVLLVYLIKPNYRQLFYGIVLSILVYFITTLPFSRGNIFVFTKEIVLSNILPSAKGVGKASVDAFNFYALFYKIDSTPASSKLVGVPLSFFGILAYLVFVFQSFKNIVKTKTKELYFSIILSLYLMGMGIFIFSTGMLERYFFPALAPLIIIMFTKKPTLLPGILLQVVLFLNLIFAFYRRSSGTIDHIFTDGNMLLIKILSLLNILLFLRIYMLQLKAWRRMN